MWRDVFEEVEVDGYDIGVSINGSTPKPSILIDWGTPHWLTKFCETISSKFQLAHPGLLQMYG
jgi:hypothetical protein